MFMYPPKKKDHELDDRVKLFHSIIFIPLREGG